MKQGKPTGASLPPAAAKEPAPAVWLTGGRGGRLQTIAAVLVLVAAIPLGYSYATYPVNARERAVPAFLFAAKKWVLESYKWFYMNEAELATRLSEPDMDLWHSVVFRTALTRWRLRDSYPELYDALHERWARGWWVIPPPVAWSAALEKHDRRWLAARRNAIEGGGVPQMRGIRVAAEDDGTGIWFPQGVRTGELGSVITVIADVAADRIPAKPRVVWCVTTPRLEGHRRRLGAVRKLEGAPAGRQRIAVDLDMSSEPLWLNPGTVPVRLLFFESLLPGDVVAMEFSDSPLLRVD